MTVAVEFKKAIRTGKIQYTSQDYTSYTDLSCMLENDASY